MRRPSLATSARSTAPSGARTRREWRAMRWMCAALVIASLHLGSHHLHASIGVSSVALSLHQNDLSARRMHGMRFFAADFATAATVHEAVAAPAATETPRATARGASGDRSGDGSTTRTSVGMPVDFFAHDFVPAVTSLPYEDSEHAATVAREAPRTVVADAGRRSPDRDTPIGAGDVVGANGSGKTSVLEAVYYLGHGRSFRSQLTGRVSWDTVES